MLNVSLAYSSVMVTTIPQSMMEIPSIIDTNRWVNLALARSEKDNNYDHNLRWGFLDESPHAPRATSAARGGFGDENILPRYIKQTYVLQ